MRTTYRHLQQICVVGILLGLMEIGLGFAVHGLSDSIEQVASDGGRATDPAFRDRVQSCHCGPQLLSLLEQYETMVTTLSVSAAEAQDKRSVSSMQRGALNALLFAFLLYGIRGLQFVSHDVRRPTDDAL